MASPSPRFLITCTQPRANEIVKDLKKRKIDSLGLSALTVVPIHTPIPEGEFDGLLISSRHAVIDALPEDLPILAVGQHTANLVRQKGLSVVRTGHNNVKGMDLAGFSNLLYPCTTEPSFIPDNVAVWPVYKTMPNSDFFLPPSINNICVFSHKAAKIILPYIRNNHSIICLSEEIATTFIKEGIRNLAVSDTPRYDRMKELILKRHIHS
jgi:uroporphyrinogen-III synthase